MSVLRVRNLAILLCAGILISGCAGKKKTEDNLARQQVEQLYNKGLQAMRAGNYKFAIDYYRALESNYPYGEYTEQAKLDMIFALNKSGKTEAAIEAADNFVKLYPTHKNVDYAYYMKGVATFDRKMSRIDKFMKGGKRAVRDPKPLRDSETAFNELIRRYPNSVYSEDARQRIVYIRNELAERELAVAQFYYDNETYVAAVNRCKTVIYTYETTPAVEKALILMEKAYLEMGLAELAQSTRGVLLANFPDNASNAPRKEKKGFFSRLNPF